MAGALESEELYSCAQKENLCELLPNLKNNPTIFLIFGSPGSGKSTLAREIVTLLPLSVHISMGQVLRDLSLVRHDIQPFLKGNPIPDPLAASLIRNELKSHLPLNKTIILEGHPQNFRQYKLLVSFLNKHSIQPIGIWLNTRPETCFERCLKRARPDDRPQIITKRLQFFQEITLPVIHKAQQDFTLLTIEETL